MPHRPGQSQHEIRKTLSVPERKRGFELAVEEAHGHCGIVTSCSDTNLDMERALARYSQAVGTDYIVVHSPVLHFGAHTVETVYEYYRRACASSPQRLNEGSLCRVIERTCHRPAYSIHCVIDAFEWYRAICGSLVHRSEPQLQSNVEDLPRVYGQFNDSPPEARTCPAYGTVHPGRDWTAWHGMRDGATASDYLFMRKIGTLPTSYIDSLLLI